VNQVPAWSYSPPPSRPSRLDLVLRWLPLAIAWTSGIALGWVLRGMSGL
jgi:hypothetical protein